MRVVRRMGGLVLLAALAVSLVSCESTQPLQVTEQEVSLSFNAVNSMVKTFNVWDLIEDNNGDFVADDGVTYLWCEAVAQNLIPITLPWTFSVEISVIRKGSTSAEVLTSTAARAATANVANYDTQTLLEGATPQKQPVTESGRTFRFSKPRRLPAVNANVMRAQPSPLATLRGAQLGMGLCSIGNPGDARIDGQPQPFNLTINKGDTFIVKARLANEPPSGMGLGQSVVTQKPTALVGRLMVDGRMVNVQGTSAGSALSFSFTSR